MSALHGLVLLYEKQFQIAALRNTDTERAGVGHLSTSLTATGWIHVSIEPADLETSFENDSKSSSQHLRSTSSHSNRNSLSKSQSPPISYSGSPGSNEDHLTDSLQKKKSPATFVQSSSPSSLSSIAGKNFYTQVWKGMIFLASDPNPSVARMAQHVVHSIHDKVSLLVTAARLVMSL